MDNYVDDDQNHWIAAQKHAAMTDTGLPRERGTTGRIPPKFMLLYGAPSYYPSIV